MTDKMDPNTMKEIILQRRSAGETFTAIAKDLGVSRNWCHKLYSRVEGPSNRDLIHQRVHHDAVVEALNDYISSVEECIASGGDHAIEGGHVFLHPRDVVRDVLAPHGVSYEQWRRAAMSGLGSAAAAQELWEDAVGSWEMWYQVLSRASVAGDRAEEIAQMTGLPLSKVASDLLAHGHKVTGGPLAQTFHAERLKRKLTLQATAFGLGVSIGRVWQWENSRQVPPVSAFEWLASITPPLDAQIDLDIF